MVCVNRVFPPQKLNSNETLQLDTIYAALFNLIASVSALQFTVQMSKLNRLGKTYRKRIFVVELKTSLALLLRTNCLREFRYKMSESFID